jgi:hypothetical protein
MAKLDDALLAANEGTIRIPANACRLADTQEVAIGKKSEGGGGSRSFSMLALTGKTLDHWWFGKLAIELSGIRWKARVGILKDHDTEQRLGVAETVRVEPGRGLVADGRLIDNEHSRAVLADHDGGFPWQASVYLVGEEVQILGENEAATVNGQSVQGPAAVFRRSNLREISFCALGQDDDTSATPLSAASAEITVAIHSSKRQQKMEPENDNGDAAKLAEQKHEAALKSATENAAKAERDRVAAILKHSTKEQRELAESMIAEGVSLSDAMLKINADLVARLNSRSNVKASNADELAPIGASNGDTSKNGSGAKNVELSADDRWASDGKTRDEWLGDKAAFLAYEKNKAQHRVANKAEELR